MPFRFLDVSSGASLVLAAIAAALPLGLHAQSSRFQIVDEQTFTQTLAFAGGGDRMFDLRTINGSIRVEGWDGATVELSVRRRIRAETDADVSVAQRDVRLDIVERTARVEAIVRDADGQVCGERFEGRREWDRKRYDATFDFTVRVPRGVALRLCTVNGGDVLVKDTAGDFDVDNVNGRITMQDIRGSGHATTVNGGVTVSFAENPRDPSSFKTVNGNVTVTFQNGFAAELKMKTFNGGLFSDFEVEAATQPVALATERRDGRTLYRSNTFTVVRAGGGGPELTFDTLNGNVRVLRAER
jgi:DUF4097 and DUF4098 domain-containing protein YvlB